MTSCSDAWGDLPALGTAPTARFWLALEQDGSWGAKAFTESSLDPAVGRELTALVDGAGGRAVLVRDPLEHTDGSHQGHRVFLAGGTLDAPWVGTTTVADPAELVEPLRAWLGDLHDEAPDWLEPADPLLLVCTNGRRDQCCAVKGRPVAVALAREFTGRVWESSHLHGHRFASTALALPSGQMFARMDADLGRRVLVEPAPVVAGTAHERGRTQLTEPVQVADVLVRQQLGDGEAASLSFDGPNARGVVHVRHADGRHWDVEVVQDEVSAPLAKSCGKAPECVTAWAGRIL